MDAARGRARGLLRAPLGLSRPASWPQTAFDPQIWTVANDPKTGKEIYQTCMGKYGKAAVADVMSAIFINAGVNTLGTGT